VVLSHIEVCKCANKTNVRDVKRADMLEEKGEVEDLGLMESGGEKVAGSFSADSGGSDSPQIEP
jgi:hypothetical protein